MSPAGELAMTQAGSAWKPAAPASALGESAGPRRSAAPLLIGASIGAIAAGRWEVLALALAVAIAAARMAGAAPPGFL
jgi:hypothetical protein